MKLKNAFILCLICILTLAACSNSEPVQEANGSNQNERASQNETPSETQSPQPAVDPSDVIQQSDSQIDDTSSGVDNMDVPTDWVDAALDYAQGLESTSFRTVITEQITYDSGDEEQSLYSTMYDGKLLRSPVQANIEMSFDGSPYWHKLYIDEDKGHFLITNEDSEWQSREFQPEFKTMERIEELVHFFADNKDKLAIEEQDDIVYIGLNLVHDEFVVNMGVLETTIFNDGDYFKHEYEGYIPEGDFLEVSFSEATLVMDPSGMLTGYIIRYTSHNTSRLDDSEYDYEYLMVVELYDQNAVESIVIPEDINVAE